MNEACRHAQQRTLPRSVCSQQCDHLAGLDIERNLPQGEEAAVLFFNFLEMDADWMLVGRWMICRVHAVVLVTKTYYLAARKTNLDETIRSTFYEFAQHGFDPCTFARVLFLRDCSCLMTQLQPKQRIL